MSLTKGFPGHVMLRLRAPWHSSRGRLDRSRQIQRLPSLDTLTKKKRDELIESVRLDPRNEGGDTLYDETPVTDRGCDLISSSDNSCQKWRRRESNPRPVISPRKLLRV